jgi:hypothetical protein
MLLSVSISSLRAKVTYTCASRAVVRNPDVTTQREIGADELVSPPSPNTHTHTHTHTQRQRHCMYKVNFEARSHNRCCRGKAVSITYSEHVFVTLIIQHAMRMRRNLLPSVASLAVCTLFFQFFF